jgi:hypothetical protein
MGKCGCKSKCNCKCKFEGEGRVRVRVLVQGASLLQRLLARAHPVRLRARARNSAARGAT